MMKYLRDQPYLRLLVVVLSLVILLCFIIALHYNYRYIVPLQIVIVIVLCLLTFSDGIPVFINNVVEYVYPVKFLLGITASCLLLIGFVVSFHTEVFTAHDHYNVAQTPDSSKRNGYDWFNLQHVMRFPFEQFNPKKATIQINKFDLSGRMNNSSKNFLFIIDKTASTQESPKYNGLVNNTKSLLKDGIAKDNSTYREYINDIKDLSDLLLLSALNDIYFHNPHAKFRVGLYWGDKKQPIDYINDFESINQDNFGKLIISYINKLKNHNSKSYTDYEEIITDISEAGCSEKGLNKDTVNEFSVTIIGDFYHENRNNSKELTESIYNLKRKNIKQINLLKLPINYNMLLASMKVAEADSIASNIINIFKKRFQRELLYCEINTSNIVGEQSPKDFINSQIVQPVKFLGEESEISVYYPYSSAYTIDKSLANIKFYRKGSLINEDVLVTVKNYIGKDVLVEITANDKNIVKLNETSKVSLSNGELSLSFIDKETIQNCYVDLYFPETLSRIIAPVTVREKMTNTSCLCLIFLYTLLYSSVTSIVIIFGTAIWMKSKHMYKHLLGLSLCVLPLSVFSLSYFYNVDMISDSYSTEYWWLLVFSAIFPFLYIVLLKSINVSKIIDNIDGLADIVD